ncbi:hypothetical protein [Acidisphaera rubrifaciens]|uniref:Uncharacterized protein n=1 Tax=Acidisphaera rubrifaciens HS-AP3 TaxID=1231350 RepID=A0A0D6P4S8_9PROT|nr:hypothetical protein [Acidisphaera rubrifaciens]GAN76765.1 hypothetical protein Asru_0160_15 [Acidisphaera rubrifaciens HS-AP3]
MTAIDRLSRNRVEVACDVDIEQSPESLHAYAVPDGIDIRPGDTVIVHADRISVGFGEHIAYRCPATVLRAGPIARAWTQLAGLFELTELYEVGFMPKETP